MSTFENKPELGKGIFTPSEIADILRLPKQKVQRWIHEYWDGKLGQTFERKYSWKVDGSKAVSFHTFVELYVMMKFSKHGVKPKQILKAHEVLEAKFKTPFPFAHKDIPNCIATDGNKIFFKDKDGVFLTLDGTEQFTLELITIFFKNLDFDTDDLASRYWPLGKDRSVVIDPKRKFGHPVLEPTNIYPQTLYGLYTAGDPIPYIASIYDVKESVVQDAIDYCKAA